MEKMIEGNTLWVCKEDNVDVCKPKTSTTERFCFECHGWTICFLETDGWFFFDNDKTVLNLYSIQVNQS